MNEKKLVKDLRYIIETLKNKKMVPTGRIDYAKAKLLEIVWEIEGE